MDIREMRRIVGLTQVELAVRSGIDRTRLSFAECGYVELSAEEKAAIKNAISKAAEKMALSATRNAERIRRLANAIAPG